MASEEGVGGSGRFGGVFLRIWGAVFLLVATFATFVWIAALWNSSRTDSSLFPGLWVFRAFGVACLFAPALTFWGLWRSGTRLSGDGRFARAATWAGLVGLVALFFASPSF